MDESWRMKMGFSKLPNYPPRRSTEDTATHRHKPISDDFLNPEDFTDVFGGPPRTVLSRQFSAGACSKSSSSTGFLYEDIFRQPEKSAEFVRRNGRSLPEFRIPGKPTRMAREKDSFYSDVFGCYDERVERSRSRSKASSSSVLSSEELSPLRPAVYESAGEDDVSSFASKLRPINVRTRWNSTRVGQEDYHRQHNVPVFAGNKPPTRVGQQDCHRQQNLPVFAGNKPLYNTESDCTESLRNYPFGSSRRNTSPETISMEPMSNSSFRVSADDMELNSPSSLVSSVCQSEQEHKITRDIEDEIMRQKSTEDDEEEEEDEAMSSYVIEFNSFDKDDKYESNGVDEAIAWAKEKFQTYCSESKSKWGAKECKEVVKTKEEMVNGDQLSEGRTYSFGSLDEQQDKWTATEYSQNFESNVQIEMQILDEKIRLWSNGKRADIRLLLSSLHHILWANSGWLAVPLMNIMESSQVKKAYQKARLCLHPDKLQQRGATLPQRYIAEKAFSTLQDAWTAFITQHC